MKVAIINSSPEVYNLAVHRIFNYHQYLNDTVTISNGELFIPEVWYADKIYFSVIFTWDLPRMVQIIKLFKERGQSIEIGGPAVAAMPKYIKEQTGIEPTVGLDPRFEHVPGDNYEAVFTSRGCPRSCEFCLPENTKVLTSDLRWVNIQDIKIGDALVGVQKQNDLYKYTETLVTNTMSRIAEVWAIDTDSGMAYSTKDHPWLMKLGFKSLNEINIPTTRATLRKISSPINDMPDTDDYRLGYIIGSIEGDGHINSKKGGHYICVTGEYENLDTILKYSDELGLPFYSCKINGGKVYKNTNRGVKCSRKVISMGISEIINQPPESNEYIRGWLAGIYDSEGCWTSVVRICQEKQQIREKIMKYLTSWGFHFVAEKSSIRITGGLPEYIKFIALVKPKVKHITTAWKGKTIHNSSIIKRIYSIGEKPVFNLSTTTENFVADGFITHNCIVKLAEGNKMTEYDDFPIPTGQNPWVMDNNILSTSWAHQNMVVNKLSHVRNLDLNSGFDDRIFAMNPGKYWDLYSNLKLERWRFAYDKPEQQEPLIKVVDFLHNKGVRYSNISIFCLIGWPGTTFQENQERLQFLVDIGTSPYPMRYRPLDSLKRKYVPPGWNNEDMKVLFNFYGVPWYWRKYKWSEFQKDYKIIAAQQKEKLILEED
jgi:hypothetical protein